jgi:peptidoglycan/LPS O-acetylase OafA/YrhL
MRKSNRIVHRALLAVVLLALLSGAGVALGTRVFVQPPTQTLALGAQTTVEIRIEQVSNLYGFDAQLSFDPAVLQVVDADPSKTGVQVAVGDIFAGKNGFVVGNSADNTIGLISYSISLLGEPAGASGNGSLFRVTFQGKAGGQSALTLTAVRLAAMGGAAITATIVDGTITVPGAPVLRKLYIPRVSKMSAH